MSFLTRIAPSSSKDIQASYVKKRQHTLYANDPAKTDRVQKKLQALMQRKRCFGTDWHDAYLRIHRRLQSADLTLNFDAYRWFAEANRYKTYAQAYEKGATGGQFKLKSDALNPAGTRAAVDDAITLPEDWAHAHPNSRRRQIYDAMNVTGVTASGKGGLQDRVTKVMGGKLSAAPTMVGLGDEDDSITTTNKKFKPRAKQVFAALNYGRRPHGSCITYGYSHLILNPGLKQEALYYPADTFHLKGEDMNANSQAAFNTIGALIDKAGELSMLEAIWDSCFVGHSLADTGEPTLLAEAHLFRTVKVNQDVQALVLSRLSKDGGEFTNDQWDTILTHAKEWCKRNKVRLLLASP